MLRHVQDIASCFSPGVASHFLLYEVFKFNDDTGSTFHHPHGNLRREPVIGDLREGQQVRLRWRRTVRRALGDQGIRLQMTFRDTCVAGLPQVLELIGAAELQQGLGSGEEHPPAPPQ